MDKTPEFVNLPSFGNVPPDAVLVGIHQPNDTIPPRLVFTFEHPDFPEVPLCERVPTFIGEITFKRVALVTPEMLVEK